MNKCQLTLSAGHVTTHAHTIRYGRLSLLNVSRGYDGRRAKPMECSLYGLCMFGNKRVCSLNAAGGLGSFVKMGTKMPERAVCSSVCPPASPGRPPPPPVCYSRRSLRLNIHVYSDTLSV